MEQEFSIRTQALHEEFQKRELHYLNIKQKLPSSIMSKTNLNLPLEEYLRKINQRERASEETYRNIMKQMEQLDRHTDVMSIKLERLGLFQNNFASLTLPNLSSNLGPDFQFYSTASNFNLLSNTPAFESLEHVKSAFQTNLKSVSTQTENNIYCEKCHSAIQRQTENIKENEPLPILNAQSVISDVSQAICRTISQDSHTLNEVLSSSPIIASGNGYHFTIPSVVDKNFIQEQSIIEQQVNERSSVENIASRLILNDGHSLVENGLESCNSEQENTQNRILNYGKELIQSQHSENAQNEILINEKELISSQHFENGTLSNEKELTEAQHSENENYELKSPDVEDNADTFVSKSDVESVNNEFDFLESDTRILSPEKQPQDALKSNKPLLSAADKRVAIDPSLVANQPKSTSKNENKEAIHPKLKLDLIDNKSETSGSASPPPSPNLSIASDSDSLYGKGSPLTASAAYQALLGNTVIQKKTKKVESGSESEDEVENALANVVQRNPVKSKSTNSHQKTERKSDIASPQVTKDSKTAIKGSKPPSMTKPQSKLSKNTRKALGLDTSSGSEVELAVKPPVKKIDEDSDEFDSFFD